MKAKCLMLDVDGVLVFGRPSDGQHWMVGLKEDLGIVPRELSQAFFKAAWQDVIVGRKEIVPTLQAALDHLAPTLRAEDVITYWFEMSARVVQPVLDDVRAARQAGHPVFLATNQDHSRADYLLHTVGLQGEVDGIVYSAKAGHRKPEPGFFAFAEQMTGFDAAELLLVDDTLENVEAAAAKGWQAVHWTAGDRLAAILQRHFA